MWLMKIECSSPVKTNDIRDAAIMAPTSAKGRRPRGHICKRGGTYQVLVYAGGPAERQGAPPPPD